MLEIREVPIARLAEICGISASFTVSSCLDIIPGPAEGSFHFRGTPMNTPYEKDYDALTDNSPADWSKRFDTRDWGLFLALNGEKTIGATVVAWNTPGLDMLEERSDLSVLWDIRVDYSNRRKGVGTALFQAAASWAKARGCTKLKIETQTNNTHAVRFYQKQGCELCRVVADAYPELPGETMLVFYKSI